MAQLRAESGRKRQPADTFDVMLPKKLLKRIKEVRSRPDSLGAALVNAVAGTASIKAGHALIVFATSIVLARSLGPAGYGVFSFAIALVQMLSIPSELGIPNLAVREIAITNLRKEWGRMRSFIRWAQGTIALVSLVFAVLGAVALLLWGDRVEPLRRACLWLGLLLIPLISFNALRGAMLRGLRKVLLGQLPEQIIRPLVLLLLLLVLPLFGFAFNSPFLALAAHITSVAVAFVCGLILFYRNRPLQLSGAPIQMQAATWFASSIPFGLTALMQLINGRTDILMLGFFRTDAEVGVYRVAAQISAVVAFGLQIINSIQGPHIAHLYAKGDMRRLQLMITRSSQLAMLIAVAAVVVILVFGRLVIDVLYSPDFSAAFAPLLIICVGQLFNASMGSVGSLLNMTGHERETTKSTFIGASVNISLNLLLTPRFGVIGAASATTITLIVWNVIMWRNVRRHVGIDPSPFWFRARRK
jgi:O-antigen/teichoic acid export membrane protein